MNAFMNHQKAFLRIRRWHRLPNTSTTTCNYCHATISPVRNALPTYCIKSTSSYGRFLYSPLRTNIALNERFLSTTSILCEKSSSKIEDVVKNIKEVEKEKIEEATAAAAASLNEATKTLNADKPPTQHLATVAPTEVVVKKTVMQRIWAELVHYYHGFRLLFIDINVCRKLLMKVLHGETLSRREHRLLVRTTSDIFRLVPFSVFIIVPFMEFLLPVVIKFFPGMLPSTFQNQSDEDKKIKQNLKVKIEMAKFLQKTLDDMTVQHKNHRSEAAKEFTEFFQRLRTAGDMASTKEIMKFSKLFEDEITLDSLNRQQLMALCRVLEANTIGTTNFLRFQLRMKLRSLAADDRLIQKEGIDALNLSELQSACRARGMRAYGMSEERLKAQLQEWIDLSLNEKVPPSLLLLSRALMLPENVEVSEKLKATLAALPETVATQAKAAIGEREGKIDNKTKIEIIKEEQRRIKEELEEEKEAEMEIKAKEQKLAETLLDKAPIITADGTVKPTAEQISQMFAEQNAMHQEEKLFVDSVKVEKELTTEDLKVISDALGTISENKKNLLVEKEEIKEIKEEIADYQEDIQELEQIVEQKKDEGSQVKESRAAKILYKKVNSMINKLDRVLEDLEKKEQKIKNSIEEPVEVTEAVDAVIAEEEKRNAELVRIDEMMNAIRKIQKVSDESVLEQIEKILRRMDDDRDESLKVEDVLKVIEVIGKESMNLKEKQMNEILDLIDKEEVLETESKIQKALKKEQEQRHVTKGEAKEDFSESEGKFLLEDKAEELEKTKDDADIDEKIKKVVENQNEKILSQVQTSQKIVGSSTAESAIKPKDKLI